MGGGGGGGGGGGALAFWTLVQCNFDTSYNFSFRLFLMALVTDQTYPSTLSIC